MIGMRKTIYNNNQTKQTKIEVVEFINNLEEQLVPVLMEQIDIMTRFLITHYNIYVKYEYSHESSTVELNEILLDLQKIHFEIFKQAK